MVALAVLARERRADDREPRARAPEVPAAALGLPAAQQHAEAQRRGPGAPGVGAERAVRGDREPQAVDDVPARRAAERGHLERAAHGLVRAQAPQRDADEHRGRGRAREGRPGRRRPRARLRAQERVEAREGQQAAARRRRRRRAAPREHAAERVAPLRGRVVAVVAAVVVGAAAVGPVAPVGLVGAAERRRRRGGPREDRRVDVERRERGRELRPELVLRRRAERAAVAQALGVLLRDVVVLAPLLAAVRLRGRALRRRRARVREAPLAAPREVRPDLAERLRRELEVLPRAQLDGGLVGRAGVAVGEGPRVAAARVGADADLAEADGERGREEVVLGRRHALRAARALDDRRVEPAAAPQGPHGVRVELRERAEHLAERPPARGRPGRAAEERRDALAPGRDRVRQVRGELVLGLARGLAGALEPLPPVLERVDGDRAGRREVEHERAPPRRVERARGGAGVVGRRQDAEPRRRELRDGARGVAADVGQLRRGALAAAALAAAVDALPRILAEQRAAEEPPRARPQRGRAAAERRDGGAEHGPPVRARAERDAGPRRGAAAQREHVVELRRAHVRVLLRAVAGRW